MLVLSSFSFPREGRFTLTKGFTDVICALRGPYSRIYLTCSLWILGDRGLTRHVCMNSIVSLFSPESMIPSIRHKLICSPNEECDTSLRGLYHSLYWPYVLKWGMRHLTYRSLSITLLVDTSRKGIVRTPERAIQINCSWVLFLCSPTK